MSDKVAKQVYAINLKSIATSLEQLHPMIRKSDPVAATSVALAINELGASIIQLEKDDGEE